AIFKGALKVRAREINEEMKLAAAHAIASVIPDNELSETNIIPNVFHPEVMEKEAEAVAQAARDTGVARI
ncbi:MAG: NAD-dependent malic enzyme, partial [Atribacterota bacterium]|nr:NAD-dependent malic enzyme [Atribacterota bacterium]